MNEKNEITSLALQTVLDFALVSEIDWDAIYFRFYSDDPDQTTYQFTYRKGRQLSPVRSTDEHGDVLENLMLALFDEAERETNARPMVAVIEVNTDQTYKIKFDYDNPRAYQISLLALGKKTSYFLNGEIDITDVVKDFQRDLASKERHRN